MVKKKKFGAAMFIVFGSMALAWPDAHAAFSTNITNIIDDGGAFLESAQNLGLLATAFGVAVWALRKGLKSAK